MRRDHSGLIEYNKIHGRVNPLVDVRDSSGILMNVTNPGYTGSYGNSTAQSINIQYNDQTRSRQAMYLNSMGNWGGSTPNPGTNGYTCAYLGYPLGFRLIVDVQVKTFATSNLTLKYDNGTKTGGTYYGTSIFVSASHNNTAYRGMSLLYNSSSGQWLFGWRSSAYNFLSSPTFATRAISTNEPFSIVLDFTGSQVMINVLDDSGNLIIASRAITTSNLISTNRQTCLMLGSWDAASYKNTFYCSGYRIFDGTDFEDFYL